jgi:hypothetical protein
LQIVALIKHFSRDRVHVSASVAAKCPCPIGTD